MGGEQDMRKMVVYGNIYLSPGKVMAIGTLAISGFPLLSGFFSKDEILAHTYEAHMSNVMVFWSGCVYLNCILYIPFIFLDFSLKIQRGLTNKNIIYMNRQTNDNSINCFSLYYQY